MKTYGELKVAIADWLNRNDLDAQIPEFVRLAEAKIYRELRSMHNEFVVSFDVDDDPFKPITLPDNYQEMRLVTVNDKPLESITPTEYYIRVASSDDDTPINAMYFTVINRQLYIQPWPDATYSNWGTVVLKLHYYGTEALGDSTNWSTATNPVEDPAVESTASYNDQSDQNTTRLLQIAPDLLLYGTLVEATIYVQDPRAGTWKGLYEESLDNLKLAEKRRRYAGSTKSVRAAY
jgi:hypothetical protein